MNNKLNCALIIFLVFLTSCNEVVITGQNELEIQRSKNGYKIEYLSKYCLGDKVSYKSSMNGMGTGTIIAIIIDEENCEYMIELDNETLIKDGVSYPVTTGGIYADDITLIEKKIKS